MMGGGVGGGTLTTNLQSRLVNSTLTPGRPVQDCDLIWTGPIMDCQFFFLILGMTQPGD